MATLLVTPFNPLLIPASPCKIEPIQDTVLEVLPGQRESSKSMTRRSGQNGTVVKRGNAWRGRWLEDIAGQNERIKRSIMLGLAVGKYAITKPEAKRKLRAFLEERGINSTAYVIPSRNAPLTFSQASTKWENGALELLKPSTRRTVKSQLRKHLRPSLGNIPMDAFTPDLVNDMVVKWHMKGLKRNTIKNFVTTLSLIRGKEFGKGVIKYPKQVEAKKEAPCFSPETMSAIVAKENETMYRVFFATAAGTGMRSGELRGLRVGDVDLANTIIHVRRSVWEGKEQSPKTENGYRKVGIDASLIQILKEYIDGRKFGYVFQTSHETSLAGNNIVDRHLWPILDELEIPRCGLHAFRHGRVSFLVENNVPASIIKQWIGHGSQKMIDLYTHSRPAFHQQALAKLPPIIENILPILTPLTHIDKKARAA